MTKEADWSFDDVAPGPARRTAPHPPRRTLSRRAMWLIGIGLGVGALSGMIAFGPVALRKAAPCVELRARCSMGGMSTAFLHEALKCGMVGMMMTGAQWTDQKCEEILRYLDEDSGTTVW